MRRTILTAVALFAGLGSSAVKADTLGIDFTGTPSSLGSSVWNIGWVFTVNSDITLTGLGAYDNGSLANFPQDQQVGLWNSTSGVLIASAYVGSDQGSVQIGYWGFTAIAGVTLIAGDSYTVGSQGGGPDTWSDPTAVGSNITYDWAEYWDTGASNSPLEQPTNATAFPSDAAGDFGGNIEYTSGDSTPEPGTMFLLVPGLGLLALVRRKRAEENKLLVTNQNIS